MQTVRIGIIGLGANARLRHVPGFRACPDVEIVGVCNRRPDSSRAAAAELAIPKTYEHWRQLVADPDIDAVLIGTWPYLHCDITLAALAAGKHVLTEARMARNAAEAHRMLEASRQQPQQVAQIVPSPFGMRAHQVVRQLLQDGFIGRLREAVVLGLADAVADAETPLHWRQSAELSGQNMLTLGILHETLTRWIPDPIRVMAQTQIFTPERRDADTGQMRPVGTPDSVHVFTELPDGALGLYHLSGAIRFGSGSQIHLYGSEGTLKYMLAPEDRLWGGRRGQSALGEIAVPPEQQLGWRVEQEFVEAIRGQGRVRWNDFATGVRYMEFTEAVARSAASGAAVRLPLEQTA